MNSIRKLGAISGPLRFYSQHAAAASQSKSQIFDIVVVGGGIAGASMACSLATRQSLRNDFRIAFVDAGSEPAVWANAETRSTQNSTWSNRVSSLTPASVEFLRSIGVWEWVDVSRVQPFQSMRVWDSYQPDSWNASGSIEFHAREVGQTAIGNIVENTNLVQAITHRLQIHQQSYEKSSESQMDTRSNLVCLYGNKVSNIEFPRVQVHELDPKYGPSHHIPFETANNLARIQLDSGSELLARLVIGADGAQSQVRQFAGLEYGGWEYDQRGLVATVKIESQSNNWAWQRFLPTGPLAMLPLSDEYSSLVWSLPPEIAAKIQQLPEHQFVELVNIAFQLAPVETDYLISQINRDGSSDIEFSEERKWRNDVLAKERLQRPSASSTAPAPMPPDVLGVQERSRASFPLRFRKAHKYMDQRVVLIGDAAHVIHPMAGLGLNLGIGDVQCLSSVIEHAVLTGQDIGNVNYLRAYNQQQMLHNLGMMTAIDGLWRIYHSEWSWMKQARVFGVDLLNQIPMAKSTIMKMAMGFPQ